MKWRWWRDWWYTHNHTFADEPSEVPGHVLRRCTECGASGLIHVPYPTDAGLDEEA